MQSFENFFLQVHNTIKAICLELVTPFVDAYYFVKNYLALYHFDRKQAGCDAFEYGNRLAKEHFDTIQAIKNTFRYVE